MEQLYEGDKLLQQRRALAQYYKFHKSKALVIDSGIEKIMAKYHNVNKKTEYRQIKKLVKEVHGIDLGTIKASSDENSCVS
jgi:hypothetical protein